MNSQSTFTVYTSSDSGSTIGNLIGGTSGGSLITLLNNVLVGQQIGGTGPYYSYVSSGTAYPVGNPKVAAGWRYPAISGSGGANPQAMVACYQQGAGAGLMLLVNDAGPNATSTYKEAWATGWENCTGMGTTTAGSTTVGAGTGQFPLPAQLLTYGAVVIRKSVSADSTGHYWVMFADASTCYLFVQSGDTAGYYTCFVFGDVFSLAGSSDLYRCFIGGRNTVNAGNSAPTSGTFYEHMDVLATFANNLPPLTTSPNSGTCRFFARTWGGGGASITANMIGDLAACANITNDYGIATNGLIQCPNGPDSSLYLAPLRAVELATGSIRGRFRGLYQICHALANFADGQTFSGGGDYAGKQFRIVKYGMNGGGWAVETSSTVETN